VLAEHGGLQPGEAPAAVAWSKQLWLILPQTPTSAQSQTIKELRASLSEYEDLTVVDVTVRNTIGAGNRKYPLVVAADISRLYRAAHRARVAVLAFGEAKVLLDASEQPSNPGCVPLERYVQYKCYFRLITRPPETRAAIDGAMRWLSDVHLDGIRDPRCFPTVLFPTRRNYSLDATSERVAFVRTHKRSRTSSDLTDANGRVWCIGPAHTIDLIQVAGFNLPKGFHWDVQGDGNSVLATGWETWILPGRGYTNVHPDAYIRGGSATKTFPLSPKKPPKAPRTPRNVRQGKKK